jgi:hypothetical protein
LWKRTGVGGSKNLLLILVHETIGGFIMKHFVKTSVATAVVLGSALAASSAFAAGIAGSIVNTRHNLGATGSTVGTPNNTADTGEICIFCHTPHGGDNSAPVPLWNKVLSTGNFSVYDQLGTSTLDAAVGDVGSVSLACLTCHDGTQAIDNIINAPGSGGFDPTGGGANGLGWNWSSPDGTLDTNGAFTGGISAGNIWQIGTDLTNDHPVSMQYAGGGYSVGNPNGGAFGTGTRDVDFAPALQITSNRWYVDNKVMASTTESTANEFDKWDFKLYTRDTSTGMRTTLNGATFAGEEEPFVECGSCHDPHFQTTTFLRMQGTTDLTTVRTPIGSTTSVAAADQSNTGSQVCLTCHTK